MIGNIIISRFIQPRNPSPEKLATYECGEEPKGSARVRYNFRFYTVALTFIIFEAEILFMFPWAIVYGDYVAAGQGTLTFFKGILFIGILALGLIYAWAKGDLDWVKPRPAFTYEDVDAPPEAVFGGPRLAARGLNDHGRNESMAATPAADAPVPVSDTPSDAGE